jgi:hypothetical protein
MKYYLYPLCLVMLAGMPAHAQDIDLDCKTLAEQMVERLSAEGLLTAEAADGQRARAIGMELCGGAQASAQQQHEVGKQEAVDNRLREKQPEKAGNRRLRNLKR